MIRKIFDRPTGDILVLLVTITICISVMAAGLTITLISLLVPESDTRVAAAMVTDAINTLIGLLAGFIAGRTEGGRNAVVQSKSSDGDTAGSSASGN